VASIKKRIREGSLFKEMMP